MQMKLNPCEHCGGDTLALDLDQDLVGELTTAVVKGQTAEALRLLRRLVEDDPWAAEAVEQRAFG